MLATSKGIYTKDQARVFSSCGDENANCLGVKGKLRWQVLLDECCDAFGKFDGPPPFVLVGIFEALPRISNTASVAHELLGGRGYLLKGRIGLGALLRQVKEIMYRAEIL